MISCTVSTKTGDGSCFDITAMAMVVFGFRRGKEIVLESLSQALAKGLWSS
ncbi:hypothetical protein F383_02624 [Gossypium arboreum]|uniref:Uncharacterized protein n=1 Tax=Gossypium arboreum TaxID=29729 RepID=A0A0B0NUI0_GOSAR|nr:hypothetical protein F383_02624 [Gossypium arboreum]